MKKIVSYFGLGPPCRISACPLPRLALPSVIYAGYHQISYHVDIHSPMEAAYAKAPTVLSVKNPLKPTVAIWVQL